MNREVNAVEHPAIRSFPTAVLAKCFVLALAVCTLLAIPGSLVFAQAVVDGGLTAPEIGWSLGANLLVNGDFSQGTAGWTLPSNCFSLDPTTPAPNGAGSLLMSDSATCNNLTPVAVNSLKVTSGQVYTLSGRAQDRRYCRRQVLLAARCSICSVTRRSPITDGTTDWTSTTLQHITVPAGAKTFGPSADLRPGDQWRRVVCEPVIAAGDTARAADVPAVPELSRNDVLRSEPGRQRGSDRHSARGNFAVEPASGTQRDRRQAAISSPARQSFPPRLSSPRAST